MFLRKIIKALLGIFIALNILVAVHAYRFTHFYDNPTNIIIPKPENLSTTEKISDAITGVKLYKRPLDKKPSRPFETIHLLTKDALNIEGWYVPIDAAKGTVLLFHGHTQNKGEVLDEANFFNELGYNTFSIDFRACGNSSGEVCLIGYQEGEDIALAYNFIAQKGEKNIIIWGVSMGASAILKAFENYPELKPTKVILDCPFATMTGAVKGRLRTMHLPETPLSEMLTFWGGIEQSYWAFGYKPAEYAKKIHCPVLLRWGAKDQRVLRHETDTVFQNIGTTKKRLVIFETAIHEAYLQREPEKCKKSIRDFLEE